MPNKNMEVSQLFRFKNQADYQPGVWQKIGDTMPQISLRTSSPDQPPRYMYNSSQLKQQGSNIQSGGYLAPYSKGFSAETEEDLFDSTEIKPRITSYLFEDVARPPESGYMIPVIGEKWKTEVLNEELLATPKVGFFTSREPQIYGGRSELIYGGQSRMPGQSNASPAPGSDGGSGPIVELPPNRPSPLNPGQCGGGNY